MGKENSWKKRVSENPTGYLLHGNSIFTVETLFSVIRFQEAVFSRQVLIELETEKAV